MNVLPVGTFPLGTKKIVFVPDGILILTPCESRPISLANNFLQMNLVVTLIICLYSRDTPVLGQLLYWLDIVPEYLLLVLKCDMM